MKQEKVVAVWILMGSFHMGVKVLKREVDQLVTEAKSLSEQRRESMA